MGGSKYEIDEGRIDEGRRIEIDTFTEIFHDGVGASVAGRGLPPDRLARLGYLL
jgi:hypothetical protein